jgi:hypothetical protein
MTARSSFSEMALASDILAATGGAGTTGVAIGITTMRFTIAGGITRQAGRFITATDSIEANAPAVIPITLKELHSPLAGTANAHRVITTVPKERHSLPAEIAKAGAVLTTVSKERLSLSAATTGLPAAMPSLAARAAFAPALSAVSVLAERNGVFRRAEAPA